MSDTQFVADSLAELLTAIANGVREAQEALSQMPALDAFGRPMPTYHLPYLDFQLQVDMENSVTESGTRLLRILPTANKQKNSTQEISSTLSGRFVAIPPGEGLPMPVLRLSNTRLSARSHTIQVQLINTAGEPLVGVPVELNLNEAASIQLSAAQGISIASLRDSTLEQALLITDEQGLASTKLQINAQLPAAATVVISAEYGQYHVNLSVTAGSAA
ncbi:hypothetical protein DWB84_16740 [Saccharophagus sp. K07]|jgi:hypothetical protein|uniref:hypothetical protein n=1 Tax=Saccharophagus sp. K07 TaxID=2283636 RepID=UPI0016529083|nr:hypothetical protein [Saccharophagus sp. K07]MBC6907091.1 hypothetical protein [Saccharophagus sp. K07]